MFVRFCIRLNFTLTQLHIYGENIAVPAVFVHCARLLLCAIAVRDAVIRCVCTLFARLRERGTQREREREIGDDGGKGKGEGHFVVAASTTPFLRNPAPRPNAASLLQLERFLK